MGSLSLNTDDSSESSMDTPPSPVACNVHSTPEKQHIDLDGDIEEIKLFNSRIAELCIRRNPKPKVHDLKVDEDDKAKKEEKTEEAESPEAKIERLCKPESAGELFEYRKETDIWGTWKKIERDEFFVKTGTGVELLLLRRHTGDRDLTIWSPYLRKIYRQVAGPHKFEGVRIWSTSVVISSPYSPLFHCRETIRKAIYEDPQAPQIEKARWTAIEDLATTGFIGRSFETARQGISEGYVANPELWALFQPEDLVVVKNSGPGGLSTIMKLASIQISEKESVFEEDCKPRGWTLQCLQVTWNGSNFCEESKTIKMRYFAGNKKISDLKVIPLRLHPNQDQIDKSALARGRKYAELCTGKPRTMMFTGMAKPFLHSMSMPWQDKTKEPEQVQLSGRVVVDPKALINAAKFANLQSSVFTKAVPQDEGESNVWTNLGMRRSVDRPEEIDEMPDLKLCPPTYPVFSLDEQEWYDVGIECLSDVDWQIEAFKDLEITDEQKKLLAGLTKAHSLKSNKRSQDMISGKGRGLVILLYGPPGVGKTLTAEALSELTNKPLYRVNLGVISAMSNWEANLEHIFHCAHAWNAILLIDEAEVVLEERAVQGGTQNRWASVFLRKIEYFQGILILTTNLVNVIDEAFQSRISIGIEYPQLDVSARTKIFRNFINRMDPTMSNRRELSKMVPEWAEEDLNARQIRNVLQICESLVLGRGSGRVEPEDVEMVLRQTLDFTKSVEESKAKGVKKKKKESIYNKWST